MLAPPGVDFCSAVFYFQGQNRERSVRHCQRNSLIRICEVKHPRPFYTNLSQSPNRECAMKFPIHTYRQETWTPRRGSTSLVDKHKYVTKRQKARREVLHTYLLTRYSQLVRTQSQAILLPTEFREMYVTTLKKSWSKINDWFLLYSRNL